ncbi:unnamed protein product [Xylocopa violacea]|uniref:MD-2-related lipid-recognition domain-containing protein n=1 Tax=Xylocopa violacea TaxID=135666 RepID=A0ABP1PG55_XYLVO
MNRNCVLLFGFLLLALSVAVAELVPWQQCTSAGVEVPSNCTIHEVYIDPCKEAAESKPCKLKRGITGNITFHYTPTFSSEKVEGRMFWASQVMDIPFLGMDPNACLATTCPLEAGKMNTYHVDVPILNKYPVRTYDLKWKMWNEEGQECCFLFQIKITK